MTGTDSFLPDEVPIPESKVGEEIYMLSLYIAGPSVLSRKAIVNTRRICEKYLPGRYRLEVVDLCQFPEAAAAEQIVAAPTLVKKSPAPLRRFVGDMSRSAVIIQGLGLFDDDGDFTF